MSSALHRAAVDLGARVAEVLFAEPDGSTPHDVGALARILGRMYDAIDCGSLAASTVERIELEAGVPVYAGLGQDDRPARALGDLLTLFEAVAPAGAKAGILFVGDTQTLRSRTFLSAAQEMGFDLKFGGLDGDPAADDADLMVDATRPQWSLRRAGMPIDEERRSENHRCVMQTVLLDTIVRT
jgi:ornithine carbamoyltransferase